MKYIFGFIATLIITTATAQTIVRKDGLAGLVDASGSELLPQDYNEITQVVLDYKSTHLYILWRDEKYGLYSSYDRKNTGCIYDLVEVRNGFLRITLNKKKGFVARPDDTLYTIVAPIYDELFPAHEENALGISGSSEHLLSARKDSLWGIVSCADGRELIPCKYPFRVERTSDYPLMRMSYPDSFDDLLINLSTGAEFPVKKYDRIYFNPDRTLMLIVDYHHNTSGELSSRVCNVESGFVLWSHTSKAYELRAEFISDQIVRLEETYRDSSSNRSSGRRVHSFYNVTNGALLLRHEGDERCQVSVTFLPDRFVVYTSKVPNGRKEEIGVIFR